MRIAIACDHAAFEFKNLLIEELSSQGHEVEDFGCGGLDSCDYPDFGIPAAQAVSQKTAERAILCCNNGIGMSILANKVKGCVAAMVYSELTAQMTRKHHNSNILCLGAQQFSTEELMTFTSAWMNTEFAGGRHDRRIGKARDLENNW